MAGSVLGPGVAVGEDVRAGVKEGAAMTSMPGLALGLGVGVGAGEPQAARPRQQRAVIPARTRRPCAGRGGWMRCSSSLYPSISVRMGLIPHLLKTV